MKQKLFLLQLLVASCFFEAAFSQNVGIGTVTPNSKAILDISSPNLGVLIPRMDRNTKTAISNPPEGLMVYDSTQKSFYYYSNGWKWLLNNNENYWSQSSGNIFRSTGSVGIGSLVSTDPSALLHLNSINQGMLLPRMTETNRNNINTPANGLIIYNSNQKTINLYDGTQWQGLQYNLPKGTMVLSDSSNHTGLQGIGFIKAGYYQQDLTTIIPGTLPAKTWYKINQSEDDNSSSPGLGHVPPTNWYSGAFITFTPDSIYRYNPVTDLWSSAEIINGPIIPYVTQILCNNEIIIWDGVSQSGWKINLTTNTASVMNTNNSPSSRLDFTTVWTGTQVLFWGGVAGSGCYSNGAAYTPSTNTWSPIAAPGLAFFFFGRENHTAVWTGTEMIIWGGNLKVPKSKMCVHYDFYTNSEDTTYITYDSTYFLPNGIKYNPSTGVYTAIAGSSLTGRKGHSAIWTGAEMVIWGGSNVRLTPTCANPYFLTGSVFNSGAKYNPVTNTWVGTTTAAGLTGRSFHQALWTGSKMIVVGGPESKNTDSYNPATNLWNTNDYPDAPVYLGISIPYKVNLCVWAGDKLICGCILGGGLHKYRPYVICENPLALTQYIDETKIIYLYRKN